MNLLSVAEAQARLLALAVPVAVEEAPIDHCAGRWLSAPLIARRDQPWADLSAMDGYAVASADAPGPWRIVGESSAGQGLPPLIGKGEAVRIFTGAPVPPGADAILIQENAVGDGERLEMTGGDLSPAQHIRAKASDFAAGSILMPSGVMLTAPQIGLAVLAGHGALPVRRKLRVAILSTGNELVAPGAPVPPGALPSSNTLMLRALLSTLPCEVMDIGIVPDDLAAMTQAFDAARDADIIVSTGGASVGDHDLVRPGFEAAGGRLDFWKIRMRPGKPLIAGMLDDAVFLGLPGNPVAAFVTGLLFLLPLVRHLSGSKDPFPSTARCRLGVALPRTGGRDDCMRAYRTGKGVVLIGPQDSAATFALANAACLIIRLAGSGPLPVGAEVDILPFA